MIKIWNNAKIITQVEPHVTRDYVGIPRNPFVQKTAKTYTLHKSYV